MLPFGLDTKTVIVTVLFMMFVVPWVRAMLLNRSNKANTTQPQ